MPFYQVHILLIYFIALLCLHLTQFTTSYFMILMELSTNNIPPGCDHRECNEVWKKRIITEIRIWQYSQEHGWEKGYLDVCPAIFKWRDELILIFPVSNTCTHTHTHAHAHILISYQFTFKYTIINRVYWSLREGSVCLSASELLTAALSENTGTWNLYSDVLVRCKESR
jgi:hypothetical protein